MARYIAELSGGNALSPQERTDTLTRIFESFGNYIFLKRLAVGGMAEVFLARPATFAGNGRIQVIKRVLPHVATNPLFQDMFQSEIQVILGFNHPHVVQLHDFGEFNQRPFIAMEYIEGKSLKEVIREFIAKNEKLPVPMALSLVAQAASGLGYAHTFVNKVTGEAVNAIHRDISPHNLILSYEGNLKVIDFGIAKAASGMSHEPTSVGTLKGKIAYLSPEQINGQPVDARSDIFSLGIVAWELLTLRRPFSKEGDSEVTVIGNINNCDRCLVPPSTYNSDVPPEVDNVVLKALRKNPDDRFASAHEFQSALRHVMLQFYPKYSYSDTGQMMQGLFSKDIVEERKELRELNQKAQQALTSDADAPTVLIEKSNAGTDGLSGLRSSVPGLDTVDSRLMKIESLMKQKASNRHYLMLAFYVISIVLVKLDHQFSFLNFIFDQREVSAPAVASAKMISRDTASKKPVRQVQSQPSKAKKNPRGMNKKIKRP